jgi:aspartate 1-decarboxylase
MHRHLMKSKIHPATITAADLHYEGSLTLDQDLMDAAARSGLPGDLHIVIAYAMVDEKELAQFRPRVVFVDLHNRVVRSPLRAEH